MDNPVYSQLFQNQERAAKAQYAEAAKATRETADKPICGMGMATEAVTSRRSHTLAEEAEKNMRHHAEAHGRHSAAYEFLSGHPEFDEFVRLVRSGSIQF